MTGPETPTGVHLGTFPQGSQEWLDVRRNGIGGSEIAAVLGLSPFESRYSLWSRKMGITGGIEQTPAMRWGHYAEPALLGWYNDTYEPITTNVGTYAHRDRPWAIANPDALTTDGVKIVEAKTDCNAPAWGKPGTDSAPPYYRAQKLWYMDVLGYHTADLIASISGTPPELWTLTYNPADAEYLRVQARGFLDSLTTGTEPTIDGHKATYETIRSFHPTITPKQEWHLNDDLADAYQQACEDTRTSETAKRQATSRILRAMGNAQYALHDGRRIASRQTRSGSEPFLVATRKG